MPKANRFFVPEHVWHITHRCHKKEFLLKFARDRQVREERWTESLAVGGRDFITGFQNKLRTRGKRRKIAAEGDGFIIREGLSRYGAVFGVKNEPIASKNALLWDVIPVKTVG